jgi:hypothetical protein
MQSGLLDPAPSADSLSQRFPRLAPAVLARILGAAPRAPALALRMSRVLARMAAVQALYRIRPRDPARLRAWSQSVAAVFGEAADGSCFTEAACSRSRDDAVPGATGGEVSGS